MRKLIPFTVLALASASAFAQIKLNVSIAGKPIGTAEYTTKLLENGTKQTVLTMNLKAQGQESRVRQETVVQPDGSELRTIMEVVTGQSKRTVTTCEFDGKGAHVTVNVDGKITKKDVPLSEKATTVNPSAFWFIKTNPKTGEKVSYYSFKATTQEWVLMTSEYMGDEQVLIAGTKLNAHKVKFSDTIAYLDDKGDVYLMQMGDLKMERANLTDTAAPKR